jgi:hypothetical protein
MWNVERMICNSLWAVWQAAMAERPSERAVAWPVRREDVKSLYPEKTMLPGW